MNPGAHHRAGVMRAAVEGAFGGGNGARASLTEHNPNGEIIVPRANLLVAAALLVLRNAAGPKSQLFGTA